MELKSSTFYKVKNGEVVCVIAPVWQTDHYAARRSPYTAHGTLHPSYYSNGKATEDSPDPTSDWDIIEESLPVHTCLAEWGCNLCPDNGRAAVDREVERIKNLGCTCK